jgi:hypothetical protein
MNIVQLYAELQTNTRNVAVYRQIVDHYKNCNRLDEAEAFEELVQRKFHANRPNSNPKQPEDDQSLS